MEKKYQIFISSTYEDLKEEREQAIKAVLEMGHIPVGMEMFSAADEEQWKLIARQIEATDYYIIIIGHRYGSETEDGISYTEKEYDYAVSCGVPTLGFVIDDEAPWPKTKIDSAARKKKKIESFKSKVKGKLVHFWSAKEDLHGKISISLIKAINTNPRVGWKRADVEIGADVVKELSRLSSENSTLRSEIAKLKAASEEAADEVRDVVNIMHSNRKILQIRKTSKWENAEKHKTQLLDIFLSIAPNLINENSSTEIANNIALSYVGTPYFKPWPIGRNIVSGLIADYVALDAIEPSKKKHSVHDKESYWSLTKLGKQVLKRARRIQLEEGLPTDDEENS
ncbi:DUF4062 domain-containing protein [Simiduia agarivorans]|uniref:DUF4062 domain-containing protein n=1 Tax=Simiduia agarivorans (strain DSM 21679 / JCM 13881 / BCRC 17597 / SA1) TaxID=1117647 RepID=K4L3L2_SIMAS|nr:DUF4062 domain-containing protein [Simiduia agarivorans]AFV00783.1 hypothetical protein M5M_18270 [Simiduia agarivorans SA1 = DSM 21679]